RRVSPSANSLSCAAVTFRYGRSCATSSASHWLCRMAAANLASRVDMISPLACSGAFGPSAWPADSRVTPSTPDWAGATGCAGIPQKFRPGRRRPPNRSEDAVGCPPAPASAGSPPRAITRSAYVSAVADLADVLLDEVLQGDDPGHFTAGGGGHRQVAPRPAQRRHRL